MPASRDTSRMLFPASASIPRPSIVSLILVISSKEPDYLRGVVQLFQSTHHLYHLVGVLFGRRIYRVSGALAEFPGDVCKCHRPLGGAHAVRQLLPIV